MIDQAILLEWVGFAVRWLHVITAMAWIGSSFYFIALDLGLRKSPQLPEGVSGEEWQVHGGGFYHVNKYVVAPPNMPEHLIWFKWESYSTWLSGAALLAIVYWMGAELYLIDPAKADLTVWQGVAISAGSLALGWILYDLLCRSPLGNRPTLLMVLLFVILVAMAWGYNEVFTGRAALLHLGAFTATIMTANVFLIIIPNQKIVVADLKAGRTPDAKYGKIAKLRSTHNNYLTLPVIFLMLSNHYPLAFASEYNWIIASLVFLMGVTIRHFFNTMHAGGGMLWWNWSTTAAIFAAIVWLSLPPSAPAAAPVAPERLPARVSALMDADAFADVRMIVTVRCAMCHGRQVVWPGLASAPKGVVLDNDVAIARNARAIVLHAGVSDAMPPANLTHMEPEERAALVAWYEAVR